MRPIQYLLDLPWWAGLVLFMAANWLVGYSYILGAPICLFGAWTFSRLLKPNDLTGAGFAIVGFPLFFLVMLIPREFDFTSDWLSWLNDTSATVLYGIRAALGIMVGFAACQGVRGS